MERTTRDRVLHARNRIQAHDSSHQVKEVPFFYRGTISQQSRLLAMLCLMVLVERSLARVTYRSSRVLFLMRGVTQDIRGVAHVAREGTGSVFTSDRELRYMPIRESSQLLVLTFHEWLCR